MATYPAPETTSQGGAKTVSAHAKEAPIKGSYKPEEWEIQDIRPYLTLREWRIYLNCYPLHRSELMMTANDRANMETPPVLLGSISSEQKKEEVPIPQDEKRSKRFESDSTSKKADLAAGNVDITEDNVKSHTGGDRPMEEAELVTRRY
ncbi:hypothetical protein DTO271D3_7327 [Paecilomyces variotii]|nr:hypothetical protein DTO271D3_7327 [Paecilomyces variotii]